MQPIRKTSINGIAIEEFYWNGRLVVYIDDHKFSQGYEAAIKSVANEHS